MSLMTFKKMIKEIERLGAPSSEQSKGRWSIDLLDG
jgi:hypothetical protein